MKWMKDEELFADIDEKGKQSEDEFTRLVLTGSASKEVRTKEVYTYNKDYTPISQRGGERQKSFRNEVQAIERYVARHNHIGSFPSPVTNITIREMETVREEHANPYYNRALDELQSKIDGIEADARYETDMLESHIDYSAEGALGVHNRMEYELDKVKKAAKEAKEEAERLAKERGESTETNRSIFSSHEVEKSRKEDSFLFFEGIGSWWNGATKLTSAVEDGEISGVVFWMTLLRIPAWWAFMGCILLMCNMVWKMENPVSALLDSLFAQDMALAVLWVASIVLLLLLCYFMSVTFKLFSTIPVPIAAFSVPLLFGPFAYTGVELEEGGMVVSERVRDIITFTAYAAVILFLILIVVKSDFFSNLWDGIKTIAALFVYMGLSSVITRKFVETPRYMLYVALGFLALCTVANLIDAFSFYRSRERLQKELLRAVNEHAFTEYKALRFVWLWIANSTVADKQTYFDMVEREIRRLEQMVRQAESYAKSRNQTLSLKI